MRSTLATNWLTASHVSVLAHALTCRSLAIQGGEQPLDGCEQDRLDEIAAVFADACGCFVIYAEETGL